MPSGSAERFSAYLRAFADRDANFQVVDPVVVVWPDNMFVDGIHLDAEGARLFSRLFDVCQARLIEPGGTATHCDMSWAAARTASGVTGR
jgi:hypothetical protein